jgi:hypothetical protein
LQKDTGGLYLSAGEADRLTIRFGEVKQSQSTIRDFGLFIADSTHPIALGLSAPSARFENTNVAIPKPGSDIIMINDKGDPALVTWNYGIGRVGSWLPFSLQEEYGTMLGIDSVIMSRYFSWIVGDPERKNPPLLAISDTELGKDARVVANAHSLEELASRLGVSINQLGILNLQKN